MSFKFPSFIYDLGAISELTFDKESKEYNACDFILDNKKMLPNGSIFLFNLN